VGLKNTLVGGVLFTLQRKQELNCVDPRFDRLQRGCSSDELDVQPYGADPVFMSSSELYSEELQIRDFYNQSNFGEINSVTGMPYGFR
jgi:hypothetical protein